MRHRLKTKKCERERSHASRVHRGVPGTYLLRPSARAFCARLAALEVSAKRAVCDGRAQMRGWFIAADIRRAADTGSRPTVADGGVYGRPRRRRI